MNIPGRRSLRRRRFTVLDGLLLTLLAAACCWIVYRVRVGLEYEWRWAIIPQYLFRRDGVSGHLAAGSLVIGLLTTLRLSVWSSVLALLIGLVMGGLRIRKSLLPRVLARGYVEIVRNTPPLVLVFIFYFFVGNQVTAALGIDSAVRNASPAVRGLVSVLFASPARLSEFASALLTLALYEGAYVTEIVRAGVQAVHRGQWEAGHALGLSAWQRYRLVILPQAIRAILPSLAGQFISTIKDSAIVAVISIQELTFRGLELMSATYLIFEVWLTVTVLYLLLTGACSLGARRLEAYLRR